MIEDKILDVKRNGKSFIVIFFLEYDFLRNKRWLEWYESFISGGCKETRCLLLDLSIVVASRRPCLHALERWKRNYGIY